MNDPNPIYSEAATQKSGFSYLARLLVFPEETMEMMSSIYTDENWFLRAAMLFKSTTPTDFLALAKMKQNEIYSCYI